MARSVTAAVRTTAGATEADVSHATTVVGNDNDRDKSSGTLEWLRDDDHESVGAVEVQCPELGFQIKDLDQGGLELKSVHSFVDTCLRREDYYAGADSLVRLGSM
ncbi:hypothetical protein ACHAWF_004722 [Thalassiosira exigua]